MWRTGRALVAAQLASGGLGVLAWLLAARTHDAAAVGRALAVVGALTWAGLVGNLGLGSLLVDLLPSARRTDRAPLAGAAAVVAAATGAGLGLLVVVGLRVAGGATTATVAGPAGALAVVVGAAAWAAGVVLDHVAIAAARPSGALLRAVTSGTARLAWLGAALALGSRSATALVVGWAAAMALGTAVAATSLAVDGHLSIHRRVTEATAGPLARQGIRTHHVINILGQTPPMALPLVLAAAGRPVQAAAFGAAWQIAAVIGLVSPAVATGLFAAGSADRSRVGALRAQARHRVLVAVAGAAVLLAPRAGAAGAAAAWSIGQLAGCLVALRPLPSVEPRSEPDEDLARVRLAAVGPGERRGPVHPPPRRGAARRGHGRDGAARHRGRPASWTGVRYGPWPAQPGEAGGSDGRAS